MPHRRTAAGAAIAVGLLALVGCVGGTGPVPTPTAPASPIPSPTSPEPTAPVLVPDGSAHDNLAIFTRVVEDVWESADRASGRAYVDALVAIGFDKAAMEVTADLSPVGNPAESIQFSVLWGDECLLGQVGPATGAAVTTVAPALVEGRCLVGQTRPIDW